MKLKRFLKNMKKMGEIDSEEEMEMKALTRKLTGKKNPEIEELREKLFYLLNKDDVYEYGYDGEFDDASVGKQYDIILAEKLGNLIDDWGSENNEITNVKIGNYEGNKQEKKDDVWVSENEDIVDNTCPELSKVIPVHISEKLLGKIAYLLSEFPTSEWLGLLKGRKENGEIYVDDMVVPKQRNTSAHTEINDEVMSEIAAGKYGEIFGWIHSHNNMNVFFSGEDTETAKKFDVSIVVNNKFEMVAVVRKKLPCGREGLMKGEISLIVDENFVNDVKENVETSYDNNGVFDGNLEYYTGVEGGRGVWRSEVN